MTLSRPIAKKMEKILVDIENGIPFTESEYWDDLIHLSVKGYDKMADLIFEQLQAHLG